MKMKLTKIYTILFGVSILLGAVSCQTEPLSSTENLSSANSSAKNGNDKVVPNLVWDECPTTATQVDLLAGQNTLVGNVKVESDGINYTITYTITEQGWCLSQTHLSVGEFPEDFPHTDSGNPKIGLFEYGESLDCTSSASYTVPVSEGTYIAAHAVVNCVSESSSEDTIANLPSTIHACVQAKPGENSYFDINIDPENSLSGITGAWCLDYDTHLNFGDCFDADVYTVFDDLSGLPLDYEETIGAINWILNQDYISQGYTYGEIQFAIWKFIEGKEINGPYLGAYDVLKAREIYDAALEHLNFVPQCGDLLGVILIPHISTVQPVIIAVPLECNEVGECEETAWADGCDFPGNNWATYFHYGDAQE